MVALQCSKVVLVRRCAQSIVRGSCWFPRPAHPPPPWGLPSGSPQVVDGWRAGDVRRTCAARARNRRHVSGRCVVRARLLHATACVLRVVPRSACIHLASPFEGQARCPPRPPTGAARERACALSHPPPPGGAPLGRKPNARRKRRARPAIYLRLLSLYSLAQTGTASLHIPRLSFCACASASLFRASNAGSVSLV